MMTELVFAEPFDVHRSGECEVTFAGQSEG